jgi:hypothetical protein
LLSSSTPIVVFNLSTQLVASMGQVEGPFCVFWMLYMDSILQSHKLIFNTKIDDHGILWGNKGQILA